MGRGKKFRVMWMVLLTLTTGVLWVPFYLIANAGKEDQ